MLPPSNPPSTTGDEAQRKAGRSYSSCSMRRSSPEIHFQQQQQLPTPRSAALTFSPQTTETQGYAAAMDDMDIEPFSCGEMGERTGEVDGGAMDFDSMLDLGMGDGGGLWNVSLR